MDEHLQTLYLVAEHKWALAKNDYSLAKAEYRKALAEIVDIISAKAGIKRGQVCWPKNEPRRRFVITDLTFLHDYQTGGFTALQVEIRLISKSGYPSNRWNQKHYLLYNTDGERLANETSLEFEFGEMHAIG